MHFQRVLPDWPYCSLNAFAGQKAYQCINNFHRSIPVQLPSRFKFVEVIVDGLPRLADSFGNFGWINSRIVGQDLQSLVERLSLRDMLNFTPVSGHGNGRKMRTFESNRAEIAKSGVTTLVVVEDLKILEDGQPRIAKSMWLRCHL